MGDNSQVPADAHGCPSCPHPAVGPAVEGSPDVMVDNRPALRVTDTGIHAACCGPNLWIATEGSSTVMINNLPAHRLNDLDTHCGGPGMMIEGSPDVMVGG
ncbi:MAG TPA: PAAR domain-containing protein [Bryobacteraceae bacterium]|nr:PAAR domain-containing protein [Bryobacteraceae bacterium]